MTIAHFREKCKSLVGRFPKDVLMVAILVLSSTLSFGLGYLAGGEAGQGSEITIVQGGAASPTAQTGVPTRYVASKNGTKYYLPDCAGVERISEQNKVWFTSRAAAEAEGYTPAANCNGL